jgi:hypothetical protein
VKNKFSKLQKLLKNKKLDTSHIEEHRDCDATIAILLGFEEVEQDNDKEWVADIPAEFKDFDCLGRCVVPRFTTTDGLKLFNYMIKSKMIKQPVVGVVYNSTNNKFTASVWDIKGEVESLVVDASTAALAICKLFICLVVGTAPKKTRKKRNSKKA